MAKTKAKKGNKNDGRQIAKARDKWFESDVGKECLKGEVSGQYLRNRLERAFIAGFEAGAGGKKLR